VMTGATPRRQFQELDGSDFSFYPGYELTIKLLLKEGFSSF